MKKLWLSFKETEFYRTHKEELVIIPILLVVFFLINLIFSFVFPQSALFDVPSQMETLFYFSLKFSSIVAIAWFGLWVAFPPLHRQLNRFYHEFDNLELFWKNVYATIFFLVFLIAAALVAKGEVNENPGVRSQLKKLLDSQLNIRETTENRGPEVDLFLQSVGVKPPASWCGAYVGYDLSYFHIKNPNSAWSPNYDNPKDVIWTPKKSGKTLLLGDVFTQYYASLGRVGHVGFYLFPDQEGFFIIQAGNTSGNGSRNGDRVGRKKINPIKIHAITRYIKE